MEKPYEKPEIEIVAFDIADIITQSSLPTGMDGVDVYS